MKANSHYTEEERKANYNAWCKEFYSSGAATRRRESAPTCPKCGGSGWIKCYEHRDGGKCYRCMGSGKAI